MANKQNNVVKLQKEAVKPTELADAEQLKADIEKKIKRRDDGFKAAQDNLLEHIKATREAFTTAEGIRTALMHDQMQRLGFEDARVIAKKLVEICDDLLKEAKAIEKPEEYDTLVDKYYTKDLIYDGTIAYTDYVTQLVVIDIICRQIGQAAVDMFESWQRDCDEIKNLEAKMFDLQFPEQAKKE